VIAASCLLTVDSVAGSKVKLRAEGTALLADNRDPQRAKCGFAPKFSGYIEYDTTTQRLERFDLIALGDHWGHGAFAPGERPGRTPFGVALELAPDAERVSHPSDSVPPHALRSKFDYYDPPAEH